MAKLSWNALSRLTLLGLAIAAVGCASGGTKAETARPTQSEMPQGHYHRVAKGDSLDTLGSKYNRTPAVIARANNLGNPAFLYEGLYLWIPPTDQVTVFTTMPKSNPQTRRLMAKADPETRAPRADLAGPSSSSASERRRMLPPVVASSTPSAPAPRASGWTVPPLDPALLAPMPNLSESKVAGYSTSKATERATNAERLGFAWPLKSNFQVVKNYDDTSALDPNRGLDISTEKGAAIYAARDGKVLFNSEFRGYGNMIVIDHGDGYTSVYAHNDTNSVKIGDKVRQGQVIGRVGASGGAESPRLHFEIRRQTEPLNPLRYLPAM